jgi:hypothetical protein
MRSLLLAVALIGASAHPIAAAPGTLAVMIASSMDTSPGVLDAHARTEHCAIVRRALGEVLRRAGAEVRRTAGGARRLDVAVVAWRVTAAATQTDVAVEIRVVVSDERGRMRAIVTGRAKVSAPGSAPIAELREQAIAEAIRGIAPTLQTQLARDVG